MSLYHYLDYFKFFIILILHLKKRKFIKKKKKSMIESNKTSIDNAVLGLVL